MKVLLLGFIFTASGSAWANYATPKDTSAEKGRSVLALGNESNTCHPEGYRCGNGGDESCCGDLTCQKDEETGRYFCRP